MNVVKFFYISGEVILTHHVGMWDQLIDFTGFKCVQSSGSPRKEEKTKGKKKKKNESGGSTDDGAKSKKAKKDHGAGSASKGSKRKQDASSGDDGGARIRKKKNHTRINKRIPLKFINAVLKQFASGTKKK